MHYMALKIARDEECYITRDYFKSFKLNFRQATIIWLLMLFFILVLVGDFFILKNSQMQYGNVLSIILTVVAVLLLFTCTFVFPVLAKFDNTILRTIKNSFFIGVLQFPKTILMMILSLVPAVLFIFVPRIIPIVVLFCFTAPAWVSAKLYSKFFQKLEDQITGENAPEEAEEEAGKEDERIFRDELDETLISESENSQ